MLCMPSPACSGLEQFFRLVEDDESDVLALLAAAHLGHERGELLPHFLLRDPGFRQVIAQFGRCCP